jgi:hypothetical protein
VSDEQTVLTEGVLKLCELSDTALFVSSLRQSVEQCTRELLALSANPADFVAFRKWFYDVHWTRDPPRPIKPQHVASRWPAFTEWHKNQRKKRSLAVIEPIQNGPTQRSEADRAVKEQIAAFVSTLGGNGKNGSSPPAPSGNARSRDEQVEALSAREREWNR